MSDFTRSCDQVDHLKTLGTGRMEQPIGPPSQGLLETFPNQFCSRPYIISIMFPEYTSLCPVTGQPDFGTIVFEYIPDKLCIESKSFKLYMFAFRNHQSFMETITNTILNDMVAVLDPLWVRVKGLFSPRGSTYIHVFAEHYKFLEASSTAKEIQTIVSEWKKESSPHKWK